MSLSYRDYLKAGDRPCAVVVHRGRWDRAPENSLAAIAEAITAGHRIVEIDVRATADGGLVLLHDESFARMAGLDRRPEEMTLAEIARLRLRARDGGPANAATDEGVPTLADVFALTRGRLFLHLDVKDRQVIPAVLAAARAHGTIGEVDVWSRLDTADDLVWARSLTAPGDVLFMPKLDISGAGAPARIARVLDLAPPVCELVYAARADIAAIQPRFAAAGIALWVNTLDAVACAGHTDTAALANPDAIWGSLVDAGISVIQTDHAERLEAYLRSR